MVTLVTLKTVNSYILIKMPHADTVPGE